MKNWQHRTGSACVAVLVTLVFVASASALTGQFTKFQACPWTNPEVSRCVHSLSDGGEVVLGSRKVPIVTPVTLQGGFSKPVKGFSKFLAATNGMTLSKESQPVPGGLLGIALPEDAPVAIQALSKLFFENGLTAVDATLELARPASEIKISEANLSKAEGVALKLPVKVRLENPLLGSNCYVGSSGSPIIWELTSGKTPDGKEGNSGEVEFLEAGRILQLSGTMLVANAWEVPTAHGCGVVLSSLVNSIIDEQISASLAASKNMAIIEDAAYISTVAAVEQNSEESP